MKKGIFVLLALGLIFISCEKEGAEEAIVVEDRVMLGRLEIQSNQGSNLKDYSDVTVKVLETGYETKSAKNGYYEIKNLTEGEKYHLSFSREDIITFPSWEFDFVSNDTILELMLTEPSNVIGDDFEARIFQKYLIINGDYKPWVLVFAKIRVFASSQADVSNENYEYTKDFLINPGVTSESAIVFSTDDWNYLNYDSVYISIYRKPFGDYTFYEDPEGNIIDIGLDIQNPMKAKFKVEQLLLID